MARQRTQRGVFPHVKGLQKKRTKNGHRYVLTVKDSCGKSRSVTVKLSDNDSDVEFWQKVNAAKDSLLHRDNADRFQRYIDDYMAVKQLAPSTRKNLVSRLSRSPQAQMPSRIHHAVAVQTGCQRRIALAALAAAHVRHERHTGWHPD